MNAHHYDATGERIEDDVDTTPRTDAEIVARCNELRRILRESRDRREAQQ